MADWFRWWHGTVTDTKFMWVCRRSGQRPGDVNAVWCALLEHASQADDRGSISGFDAESLDCFLDVDDGATQRIIDAMFQKGMIVDFRLSGWDRRQPKREDSGGDSEGAMSSTERSRLHRSNKRIEELEKIVSELESQRDATHSNATQRDATHETVRVEESRVDDSTTSLSVVAGSGEPTPLPQKTAEQPAPTRKGVICGLLRQAGMSDAAPHYLTDDVWETILAKRSDEEIVEVAKAKMALRPGKRTGLKYIAPALLEDPEHMTPSARASPPARSTREARISNYAAEAAQARGEHENEHSTGRTERDITGESVRVA